MHVVNLVYDKRVLPMAGFGYLVPDREKEAVLGVVFDSCTFPTPVRSVLFVRC
jgi:protoporphyrinogen oxidase